MSKVVVLGGGVAGLITADLLLRRGFKDVTIIEKARRLGGEHRQLTLAGETFNPLGTFLYTKGDSFVENYWISVLGKGHTDLKWVEVNMEVDWYGLKRVRYPIQNHVRDLPIKDRFLSRMAFKLSNYDPDEPKADNLYDLLMMRYGPWLFRRFFEPHLGKRYQNYGGDLKRISTIGFEQLKPLSKCKPNDPERVILPTGGVASVVSKLRKRIEGGGVKGYLGKDIREIRPSEKRIYFKERMGHGLQYDHLISTIPLQILLQLIRDDRASFNMDVPFHAVDLKLYVVMVKRESLKNYREGVQAIYYPDPDLPFHRVTFPMAYGIEFESDAVPVVFECFKDLGEDWGGEVFRSRLFKNDYYLDKMAVNVRNAYPVYPVYGGYDYGYILKRLKEIGVDTVGRTARWEYSYLNKAVSDAGEITMKLAEEVKPS